MSEGPGNHFGDTFPNQGADLPAESGSPQRFQPVIGDQPSLNRELSQTSDEDVAQLLQEKLMMANEYIVEGTAGGAVFELQSFSDVVGSWFKSKTYTDVEEKHASRVDATVLQKLDLVLKETAKGTAKNLGAKGYTLVISTTGLQFEMHFDVDSGQ